MPIPSLQRLKRLRIAWILLKFEKIKIFRLINVRSNNKR